MKKIILTTLGAVALLGSAASMAMSVTITPTPNGTCCSANMTRGQSFVLTVDVSAMAGNGSSTGSTGGSFTLNFDGTRVAITGVVLPNGATVPVTPTPTSSTTSNPFDFSSPLTVIDSNNVAFSVLRNGNACNNPGGVGCPVPFNYAFGSFTAFKITGTVLPGGLNGSAAINLIDDGFDNSWTDQDANPYTGVIYTQANINIVPVPAAVWMLVSALGSLAGIKRLRRV